MSCPKCGSSDKHFCPPSLGEPGFYLCECPAPASSALAEAAREVLAYRETAKEANRVHIEMHNQITALQAEVARLKEELEAEQKVHSDAATNAFDEIAAICGCPEWHYPGQIVRDVLALRDQLRARISELEAGLREHQKNRLPHMTNADDRKLWSLLDNNQTNHGENK